MRHFPPRRLICLTEETVETLYLLGEQDRIVGVSGYAVRPPEVRLKSRVSAFTSARLDKILALKPDLVLAFSDLQADIVSELAKSGVAVHLFNQRDLAGIFAMIRTLGVLVGADQGGRRLARAFVLLGLEVAFELPWLAFARDGGTTGLLHRQRQRTPRGGIQEADVARDIEQRALAGKHMTISVGFGIRVAYPSSRA